jgi:hypothetical protein
MNITIWKYCKIHRQIILLLNSSIIKQKYLKSERL